MDVESKSLLLAVLGGIIYFFFCGPYQDYSAYYDLQESIYKDKSSFCRYSLTSYVERKACREETDEELKPSFAKWAEQKKQLTYLHFFVDKNVIILDHVAFKELKK